MIKHIPIRSLAEDDRPREKMISKGRNAVSDTELIAILLNTGNKNSSAIELSRVLLQHVNNDLQDLSRYELADFKKIKGIGDAKAVTLMAALEFGRRRQRY